MPFKEHLQQRTGSAVESLDSTVATRPAVSMRSYNNTSLPIVFARVYHLLPRKLKRKRGVSNLRCFLGQHRIRAKSISAPAAVSAAQGPSPSQVLTTPADVDRHWPFTTALPDPLRCHQPPVAAPKPRKSRSQKRRGAVFTSEEKASLEKALPAITEEAGDSNGRRANDVSIYELEAPSQVSLRSGPIYELESTSRDSVSEISLPSDVHELEAATSRDSLPSDIYELEATTGQDDSSEIRVPSVVVSDYEPILESNRQLKEENQQMSAFLQEIVTKDIIINEQLTRVKSECKAAEAALNLLWEIVRKDFDGSERVATPAQIVQFLSTRELVDVPRQLDSDKKT